MLVKIHQSYRTVVSICDSDLIGKKFEEGKLQLDLTSPFYKGDEKTPEQTKEIIEDLRKEDATFNIVGKDSVNLALETNLIKKQGIKTVQGIPISLVLL